MSSHLTISSLKEILIKELLKNGPQEREQMLSRERIISTLKDNLRKELKNNGLLEKEHQL